MSTYQVLARKWRPKTFADLVGQQHVVKALQNALSKGMLHHAYLLTGTRGVGKTTIARILAKSLNCTQPKHGEPCGQCQNCIDIDLGRFVDLLEIDAASNTGIDNIREVLENAQYAPTAGKYKVYIIDEVHMLSKSAFNAMLKTLEEPPEHVKFILATTDPHKVPITVLSRCLQFVLRNMTPQQVTEHLAYILNQEQISYDHNSLALVGKAAQGSMRDALSLLDQAIAIGSGSVNESDVRQMIGAVDKHYLYELLISLKNQDGIALIAKAQEMASNAVGFDNTLSELASLLQKIALYQTVPTSVDESDADYTQIQQLAQSFHAEQIQLYYQCIIHGKQDLALAPDEYAGFVMTLIRMLAFSPFAAKQVPINSTIENESSSATKKLIPPEQHTTIQAASPASTPSIPSNNPDDVATEATPSVSTSEPEAKVVEQSLAPTTINHSTDLPNPTTATPIEPSPPAPTTPQATLPTEQSLSTHTANTKATKPVDHAPMPEFNAANWPLITQRISRQIAAARLSLDNMAWIDFKDNVLYLALVQEATKNTVSKNYFDRIAKALSEAYQMPIRIQTQIFEEGHGWETPIMYRNRIQAEHREQAQQILEQDQAVQDIKNLFQAKWLENTIALKQTSNHSFN